MMTKVYIAQYWGLSKTSKLIKFGTRFDYSHSAYYDPEKGTVWEAWKEGVCEARPWDHHTPGTPIDLYAIEVSETQKFKVENFLREQEGMEYDLVGVLGWPLPWLSQRADRWFCSELIFAAFVAADIHLLKRILASRVSPGLLSTSPLLSRTGSLSRLQATAAFVRRQKANGVV